ncbi:MAG: outer membrane beta-barrel protein [Proteobacteria bacterium]|nr:outer membrane beta-barrel protein [Pseudomonadota bacterium]
MKISKLVLCATAALLATSAQAQWQGNWLLGVSAGGAWYDNDDNIGGSITRNNQTEGFVFNNDSDDSTFIWGFLAGYQARCNGWLLGAEVNVDWRNDDDDNDNNAFLVNSQLLGSNVVGAVTRDRDVVVGLTGRIGYEVTRCFMPYIRLGVDHGDRDFQFAAATTQLGNNNITVAYSNDDNDSWGFVGGVGAEFLIPMVQGLSLRAEWNYHSRGNDDNDIVALASDNATLFAINGGNGHEQTARASLVFNFPG